MEETTTQLRIIPHTHIENATRETKMAEQQDNAYTTLHTRNPQTKP
jgi:hypothetical protein